MVGSPTGLRLPYPPPPHCEGVALDLLSVREIDWEYRIIVAMIVIYAAILLAYHLICRCAN